MIAAGATEVFTAQAGLDKVIVDQSSDNPLVQANVQEFLTNIRKIGIKSNKQGLGSAHQMGSCRMASSSQMGAVDTRGMSWEVKGLYISDASLFPTSTGVNPMVTVYSLAYIVSQNALEDLPEGKAIEN